MDEVIYNYVQVIGSLSSQYYLNFFDSILTNYSNYVKWYGAEYNFDTEYANTYWCNSIENMIFRSLGQNENLEIIREKIISTLSNPLVHYWYKQRVTQNAWQKRADELENESKYLELIDLYQQEFDKEVKRKQREKVERRVKFNIKKLLGR